MMLFMIIVLVVIVGFIISGSSHNKAIIKRRTDFVTSFLPNARIIVNSGKHLFFMDDVKQVFGIDDSGTTYSYSGLNCIVKHKSSVHFGHEKASYKGLEIGKGLFSDSTAVALDNVSIRAIVDTMLPILRKNLHNKLRSLGITPTHEYVNRGVIWGCDINTKMFYTTQAYIEIYPFSKLLNVTMQDLSDNPNWRGCN